MKKITTVVIILAGFCFLNPANSYSQVGQRLQYSQQFRLGERIIRVAEPGQLADSVNVWGDVNSPGRYLIPVETTLPQLLSYAFGPSTIRSGQTELDWSQMRVEVHISEYSKIEGQERIRSFEYHFDEPLPPGMRTFNLENNQVITIQVKRRPSFVDYVRVIVPVIGAVATSVLLVERLGD